MAKRVIKRSEKSSSDFTSVKPVSIENIIPDSSYIVTLDCEDTKFLITFKNDLVVQCMALDGTYETITIPISQFNRGKYTYEYGEKKYTAKIEIYMKEE